MRPYMIVVLVCLFCLSVPAHGFERKAFRIGEDFGTATVEDSYLQYYYYIPCPTYSWFWGFYDWNVGDKIGKFFTIGETSTGGFPKCDSSLCERIVGFRILDFSGYGQTYPGLYTVKFNIYCSDESGCPVGGSLWESPPLETGLNWNFFQVDPPLDITGCTQPPPVAKPRILLTATHIGTDATYPQWGMDNISGAVKDACQMHDAGCLPALYPRPSNSHYSTIHSGYYGVDFQYCPPAWFKDVGDTTADASIYGYLEFAWRLYVRCKGNPTEPTTWGSIKAIYR